ncbi:MAG: MarR family transcriptional regulator [Acidimicrobiia bacterium]|nr:MAG: MarR family transcriptional regulator [Acidimicrobiia bacterium]
MGTDHTDVPLWRKVATTTLHASLILKQDLEEVLQEETGLLLADNEALLNLEHGDLRMSDIADKLVLSRGGTTKVIDRLEALGYVAREPDPEDRRATLVTITDAGRGVRRKAQAVTDVELERMWAGHLTEEESTVIVEAMQRVVHARLGAVD